MKSCCRINNGVFNNLHGKSYQGVADLEGTIGSSGGLAGRATVPSCHKLLDAMKNWGMIKEDMAIFDIGSEIGKMLRCTFLPSPL